MKVTLDLNQSVEENAGTFYDKAKKAKKKLIGVNKAYKVTLEKLEKFDQEGTQLEKKKQAPKKEKRKLQWYEKFRWFISSEGFLCIGGKDATTNDILVKKHTDKDDLVFHTEIKGSPFFIIKSEGKKIGKATMDEAAIATSSFSRAWQQGFTETEVYQIKPDQIKKELGLPKGTFMIHGKRTYYNAKVELGIGPYNGTVMCAPLTAIQKNCEIFAVITQGDDKKSDAAKKLKNFFKNYDLDLDDFIKVLPTGNIKIQF